MHHGCLRHCHIKLAIGLCDVTNTDNGADIDDGRAKATLAPVACDSNHSHVGRGVVGLTDVSQNHGAVQESDNRRKCRHNLGMDVVDGLFVSHVTAMNMLVRDSSDRKVEYIP